MSIGRHVVPVGNIILIPSQPDEGYVQDTYTYDMIMDITGQYIKTVWISSSFNLVITIYSSGFVLSQLVFYTYLIYKSPHWCKNMIYANLQNFKIQRNNN